MMRASITTSNFGLDSLHFEFQIIADPVGGAIEDFLQCALDGWRGTISPIRITLATAMDSDDSSTIRAVEHVFGVPRLPCEILFQRPLYAGGMALPPRALLVWGLRDGSGTFHRITDGCVAIRGQSLELTIASVSKPLGPGHSPFSELYPAADEKLRTAEFSFKDVIRTLTLYGTKSIDGELLFDGFNRDRRLFYDSIHFGRIRPAAPGSVSYPANTGVESRSDISTLSCVAMRGAPSWEFFEVSNPFQTAPHRYPSTALKLSRERPRFSRAVAAANKTETLVFASGTASVVSHASAHVGSVERQSAEVVRLLRALLSPENIGAHGVCLPPNAVVRPVYGVAFVRLPGHADLVRQILCQDLLQGTPFLVTEARMCRDELLVEVEMLARIIGDVP